MTKLPHTDELLAIAERTVWFKPPAEALADETHFVAHVLTFGLAEDVAVLRRYFSFDDIRTVLDTSPPGIFDPRSWSYWNAMVGRFDAPPMPRRMLL